MYIINREAIENLENLAQPVFQSNEVMNVETSRGNLIIMWSDTYQEFLNWQETREIEASPVLFNLKGTGLTS
ncbi:MAG: hypothetical protein FWF59_11620 [Turicibacter sp.]|nr:hypothetical protein [Turicibacter sp.]